MNLEQELFDDQGIIEGNLWVLKGNLINLTNFDPINGEELDLMLKPGAKALLPDPEISYENYYFFPINYTVTISPQKTALNYQKYPEMYEDLTVEVNENTTLINWMYLAAKVFRDTQMVLAKEGLERLGSAGYDLDREWEEYQAINNLLERVVDLFQKKEYDPAFGGAVISANRLETLWVWISNIKTLAILSSLGISLFAYGIASLFSIFIFEEPAQSKKRLISKVLIFASIMLMFSLTNPSLQITYTKLINVLKVDLATTLFGCLVLSSLTYFFMEIFSLRKTRFTDLALQLGMRSLKRRKSRTILTLITITLVVASSMVFVNISLERTSRIKNSWIGTDVNGVLVKPNLDIQSGSLSEYDIEWISEQEWTEEIVLMREIWELGELRGPTKTDFMRRVGFISFNEDRFPVHMVIIDPNIVEKYHNLSQYIRGSWEDFVEKSDVTIISSLLPIPFNEQVTLEVDEYVTIMDTEIFLGTKDIVEVNVIGNFEPIAISNLTKIDKSLLFGEPSFLMLIPMQANVSYSPFISEVTIMPSEGIDPLEIAEEMAYTLGLPTIANKDGMSFKVEWSLELSFEGIIPYLPPLVIAGLMMYVTMASVYEERKREFTTLATLGLDPDNTFKVFLVETLLLGLLGTFLGFFGSYALVMIFYYITNFVGAFGLSTFSSSYTNWSILSILVALFTGVVMVFLGGYIPASRAQGLSRLGRIKKREFTQELRLEGDKAIFTLPLRGNIGNGELLYNYVRETIGQFKKWAVDRPSLEGEMYGDGTFMVSFNIVGSGKSVIIPCKIRGERNGELLSPIIEFPSKYRGYERIKEIMRELELFMMGYTQWKNMRLKTKIVREAPKKQKSVEEIMAQIRSVIEQINNSDKKLKILESQKSKLSEEVFNEFKQKYVLLIEEKSKIVRSLAIGLEPYSKGLQDEIKVANLEIERITTSYTLSEINEEDYVRTCGPLKGKIVELENTLNELETIFKFLKRAKMNI
jgi:ABC-type antimicrobial peptide transport system permease subunit